MSEPTLRLANGYGVSLGQACTNQNHIIWNERSRNGSARSSQYKTSSLDELGRQISLLAFAVTLMDQRLCRQSEV